MSIASRLKDKHDTVLFFQHIRAGHAHEVDTMLAANPAYARMNDGGGRPPLTVAADLAVIDVLFQYKADPNAANSVGIAAVSAWLMERRQKKITGADDPVLERLVRGGGDAERASAILRPNGTKKFGPSARVLATQYGDEGALTLFSRLCPAPYDHGGVLSIPPASALRGTCG